MSRGDFRADLLALRANALTFDAFSRRHSDRFRRWAGYYYERWPQTVLDVEDLAQEGLIEAWRAVQAWDPSKTADVVKFVEYVVGRKVRCELERVLGWPRKATEKRAGKAAVRPISIEGGTWRAGERGRRGDGDGPSAVAHLVATAPNPEHRMMVQQEAEELFEQPIERIVAIGVGLGIPPAQIAAKLFESYPKRAKYRIRTYEEALRLVRKTLREASAGISA